MCLAICGDLVQRIAGPDRNSFFTQLEVVMTKQEIDEMMRDLPSQQGWPREETLLEKILGGVAFTAFVLILCFM
jgi:hypothetical protein